MFLPQMFRGRQYSGNSFWEAMLGGVRSSQSKTGIIITPEEALTATRTAHTCKCTWRRRSALSTGSCCTLTVSEEPMPGYFGLAAQSPPAKVTS